MTGADADLREVVAGECALLDPDVRRDRERAGALLDPTFQEFGSSGVVWDRDGILDLLATDTAAPLEADGFAAVRIAPGVVHLTYRTHRDGRTTLRSSLWRRRDGRWRMVFHQGTVASPA